MTNSTSRDIALTKIEREFAERLVRLAEVATSRGIPPDCAVRALLSAGLSFAMRFDSASNIGTQLAPLFEAMRDSPESLQ